MFAVGVQHSVHLRDSFLESGVAAAHLDGNTPAAERDSILAGLASGSIRVVCNAMVLVEGWDCPTASCAVLARPTKSLGLYRQCVGRVLRPAPGKVDALILDHSGAVFAHGLPDDGIQWSLSADDRAAHNSAQERREAGGDRNRLQECPRCSAVRLAGEPCPACGYRPMPRPKHVSTADGDLEHVRRDGTTRERMVPPETLARWHGELVAIAQERGYREGWAAHKFRERFGHWPPFHRPEPITPSPEVLAWVKSRQIAYAKSRQRGGEARP